MAKKKRPTLEQITKRSEKLLKGKKIYPVTQSDFEKVLKSAFPENKKAKK